MADVVFTTLDEVPEELRDGVKAGDDGKVTLDLIPKTKLNEFRDNNIAVAKERDAIKATNDALVKIVGDDPTVFTEELTALRATHQQVEDGKLKKSGDIESELASRTEQMKAAHGVALEEKDRTIVAWQQKAEGAENKLKSTQIDRAIRDAALEDESGVLVTALDDITARGQNLFSLHENGSVVAMNGDNVVYGADGVTPLTTGEWIQSLKKTAPHFFAESAGGGSDGGSEKKIGDVSNADFLKMPGKQRLAEARRLGITDS